MAVYGFPFFLQVSHVTHDDDPTEGSNLPGGNWHPPLRHGCFDIQSSTGWYIWDPGRRSNEPRMHRLRRPSPREESRRRMYRAATMFWDPYAYNYLHIPLDCTMNDVGTSPDFWRHPSFGVCQVTGRSDIAVIGHSEENKQLHVPGPQSWFERLLPITFQPPAVHQPPEAQRFCKLAGDLDILIALIAFSTTPPHAHRAIDYLFRPDPSTTAFNPVWDWDLPDDDQRQHRGLLVEIGYDPNLTSPAILRDWERGRHGEIFS